MRRELYSPDETFPAFYLGILFMASLTSALPLTGLYPYVALMVVEFGAAPDIDHAGYYSGYIVSAFMIGRLLTSYYWGSVADRIGRKPIIAISCFAISILSILFGMSVNLWMAILTRFFLGLLNPLNSVVKTMTSELCSRKYQPIAMSIGVGAWSVGLVVGPTIGGVLAQPAKRFPGSILNNSLFRAFPFLLPNIFTAFLSLTSLVLVYLYLPETYKIIEVELERSSSAEFESKTPISVQQQIQKIVFSFLQSLRFSGAWNLLKRKRVFYPCLAYCIVSLTSIIFDEVLILYAMSTPDTGGLGFSHLRVGYSTSVTGIPMMVTTFIITPYFNKLYTSATCFLYGELFGAFFSLVVIFLPIIYHHYRNALITVFILIATGGKCCAVVAFSSVFLLINDSVDSDERGAVNGLSVTLAGLSKAFGPVIGSVLFAWSISNNLSFPLNYSFVFFLNALIGAVAFFLPIYQQPEVEERRLVRPVADETSDFASNEIQLVNGLKQSDVIYDQDLDEEKDDDAEVGRTLLLEGQTRSDQSPSYQGVRESFYRRINS